VCGPKKAIVKKRYEIQGGSQEIDSRLMAKFLIMTIQVNLCCLLHVSLGFGAKFTRIVVIKHFAITAISCLPLDFTSFFTMAFLGLQA